MDIINFLWHDRFNIAVGIIILIIFAWEKISTNETIVRFKLRVNPKSAETHMELGMIFQQRNDYEAAIKEFREAISIKPQLLKAHYGLLATLGSLKTPENEIEFQKQSEEMDSLFPQEPMAGIYQAAILRRKNRLVEAEKIYRRIISTTPQFPLSYGFLGSVLGEQGHFEEAEEMLKKTIELGYADGNVYTEFAMVLEQRESFSEAEKFYRKALTLLPNYAYPYARLSTIALTQKRYREAEKFGRKAISLAPNEPNNYLILGLVLIQQKKFKDAKQVYRKSISISPDLIPAYRNLGYCLYCAKDYVGAEKVYGDAIKLDPQNPIHYYNLGESLSIQGRIDESQVAFKKSIEIDPNFIEPYYSLANQERNRRNYLLALTCYEKILQISLSEFGAYLGAAFSHKALGNLGYIKEYEEKARSALQKDGSYWYNTACLQGLKGDLSLGLEYLLKAKKIDETYDPEKAWEDPDLEWLRDDPRFEQIVGPKPA